MVSPCSAHNICGFILDLYDETMYIVRSSRDVAKELGTPIVASWPLVSRSVYRQVGQVSAQMRVGGPHGTASLHLRAKTRSGTWEFQQLEAHVDSDGAAIDSCRTRGGRRNSRCMGPDAFSS